uniref:CACTA en-spm transposon protein n=1 Tax=Cucumis melo TaxID=3656 RepID=A0A9I9EKJ1_CUCME
MSTGTKSSFPCTNFLETDAIFLEFANDLDNLAGGSSSVDDNSESTSQPSATPTTKRHVQSRLLELECYVAANGQVLMTITADAEKPISPHIHRSLQLGDRRADIDRQYIEVNLQRFFVLNFNDQAMNRGDCHRHFKKYNNSEEARAIHQTYWWDKMRIDTSSVITTNNHEQTIITGGQSRFYNDNMSSLSKEESQLIMWSCYGKHTFKIGRSCPRLWKMRMY